MSTPMSQQPEVVAAVRAFLIRQRHRSDARMPRYAEVAAVYGGTARAVAPVLNTIAEDCARAGEPDLSALVVLVGTGLPGKLNGEVVDPADTGAKRAWMDELTRIRRHSWPQS
jgi:hypothetical protein